MIKKLFLTTIILFGGFYCFAQFSISIVNINHTPTEGEVVQYKIIYTNPPAPPLKLQSTVVHGTVISESLNPNAQNEGSIQVQWDCNEVSGSITITEKISNTSTTLNTGISTFVNDPNYCNTGSPAKQNLIYGQTPTLLTVVNCNTFCMNRIGLYQYLWQVGDVPIGVFPQIPTTWTDVVNPANDQPVTTPTYQPSTSYSSSIKAYRRKTTITYQGTQYIFYSSPSVISIFDYLAAGTISWNSTFSNGIPVISQTPATGGLCDGYNYLYTWEISPDNSSWSVVGTGISYPTTGIITGNSYIRRRVDCGGQTLYTSVITITVQALLPGTISGGGTYTINSVPTVSQTAASGGVCSSADYVYTWERSVNNGSWVTFGTGINYPANAGVIATCTIRRKVHCVYADAYTAELTFTMQPYTSPNTENLNYVRVNDIAIPAVQSWEQADALSTGDKLQTTNYLDEFGRTIQTVVKEGSLKQSSINLDPDNLANYQDLVTHFEFDDLGRAAKGFLPYATTTSLGFYKTNAPTEQRDLTNQKYGEPVNSPYTSSQTTFDGSPLNRITNVKVPGNAWNTNSTYKGISSSYEVYKSVENVRIWNIGFNTGDKPIDAGAYPDDKLVKNITKDEKDKMIVEYKDLAGNTILKKVQEKEIGSGLDLTGYGGWLCTYYVYDDLDRLRYTIPPKAVDLIIGTWVIDDDIKNGLCFYQEYDKKGRVIIKHSPDGGEVWLVYDKRNRLVFSQDENQRNRVNNSPSKPNQWSFSLYDENDRPLVTGLIDDTRNRTNMQSFVDGLTLQNEQVDIYTGSWETITAYCPVAGKISGSSNYYCQSCTASFTNSASYYDDYLHRSLSHKSVDLVSSDFAPTSNPYVQPFAVSFSRIKGASTVSKVRILDAVYDNGNINDEHFLSSTIYYDQNGQTTQSFNDNIKGGIDFSAMQYDFSGKVLSIRSKHNISGSAFNDLLVITKNEYDILGRGKKLLKLYSKNNTDVSDINKYKTLSQVFLDEFGRAKSKNIGEDPANLGSPLEIQDFSYNIQGWLTGINKDYSLSSVNSSQWDRHFGMYFGYENADSKFAASQWNGNITGVIWRSQGDNTPRKYNYEYDNINRFKAANFLQKEKPADADNTWSTGKVDLSSFVTYNDANGNILTLKQTGIIPGTNGGVLIDDLSYQYYSKSNRLKAIDDQAFGGNNAQNGKQGDFMNFIPSSQDYEYDKNGNLVKDKNKNILDNNADGIINNFLDLPQQITIAGKSKTEYTYDAAGNKLAKKVTQLISSPPPPKTTFYIGGFVYETSATSGQPDELQFILNEEGKLRIMDPVAAWSGPSGQVNYLETRGNIEIANTGTPNKWGVWDYFIKDNLSNTRMVLTEEYHQQQMLCSMEDANANVKAEEESTFSNAPNNNELVNTRIGTPSQWTGNSTLKVSKLLNSGVSQIGPNAILKVMAGDKIMGQVKYFYQAGGSSQNNSVLNNVVSSLLWAIGGSPNATSIIKNNITQGYLSGLGGPVNSFFNTQPAPGNGNTPKAYLNYIFFDEQFRYVSEGSGAQVVESITSGSSKESTLIIPGSAIANKNGYVYIYLSNESQNIPVYFDDLQIIHNRGAIVEDNAYYPHGLKIQGISAKSALKPNTKQGYQGSFSEKDDETGYNEFALRSYDPQIGRWIQVDPYDVESGVYNGMINDPVNLFDIDGGSPPDYVKRQIDGVDYYFWDGSINSYDEFLNSNYSVGPFEYVGKELPPNFSAMETGGHAKLFWGTPGLSFDQLDDMKEVTVKGAFHRLNVIKPVYSESSGITPYIPEIKDYSLQTTIGSNVEKRNKWQIDRDQQRLQDWRYSNGYDKSGFESSNWTWRLLRNKGFNNFSEKLITTTSVLSLGKGMWSFAKAGLTDIGTTTVFRNFGWGEYSALRANGNNFSIGSNFGSKQFWLDEEGLSWWNSTKFSKSFTAKITVNNTALNYGYKFLDAGKYRAVSFDSQEALDIFNRNMKIEWIEYK